MLLLNVTKSFGEAMQPVALGCLGVVVILLVIVFAFFLA